MTFTIHWWMVVIILMVAPVIYATLRKQQSGYDLQIDAKAVALTCWSFAIGFTIGNLV